jgi:hypothetical protein
MPRRKRPNASVKPATPGRRPGRPPRSEGAGGAIRSLVAYRNQLLAQRTAIEAQLQVVDHALQVMGQPIPSITARRPGRPPATGGARPGSLKAYITDVLRAGGVMAVKDITAGVLAAGYKTQNKTLAKSVGIALTEMSNVEKVGRGKFQLR